VPNQPKTPKRGWRIPQPLWEEFLRVLEDRGEKQTDVIIRAIREYVDSWPGPK